MNNKIERIKKTGFILVLASLLSACGNTEKPIDLTPKSPAKASTYQTTVIQEKVMSSSVRLPGKLKPFNEVNIYAKMNSFVKHIYVDRGTLVKKGQLLMQLEAPEMLAAVQAAHSRFVQAQETASASKDKYKRLKNAAQEEGAVSPLDLDNALSKMKADEAVAMSEKANVEEVEMLQSYLNIKAPFNGVIVQRNVSEGALVGPGKGNDQPLLILQDLNKLRLEVQIPETYVDKVDLSKKVTYRFNNTPNKVFDGMIARSANSLGAMQSEAIEVDVPNSDNRLKPGLYCEVDIPLSAGANSLLVPSNSIVRSTERQYVIQLIDGKTHFVDIKEGVSTHDSTEVFGKLNRSDQILLHANDEIKEGVKLPLEE
ncbi:efflux RND transporter periplasmic adaptor subunit [Sphingobacterium sp. 2149]|uniref:efflux RND transporter periplasmic adaptor subunit n=1 Tax=Sphingobacterium sp. 2149 TaxID=2817763 RepID=UPI0028600147|nr:efflux RND transporter periplasmic adaptor subunit [Sphingobacterium sp. 2149]MDR6734774.1 RND family efflux transporter MFP subunit [Sphingobacterium sp. 2149]